MRSISSSSSWSDVLGLLIFRYASSMFRENWSLSRVTKFRYWSYIWARFSAAEGEDAIWLPQSSRSALGTLDRKLTYTGVYKPSFRSLVTSARFSAVGAMRYMPGVSGMGLRLDARLKCTVTCMPQYIVATCWRGSWYPSCSQVVCTQYCRYDIPRLGIQDQYLPLDVGCGGGSGGSGLFSSVDVVDGGVEAFGGQRRVAGLARVRALT
ncbi:hypothetical protein IG631_05225 [Alternaria alternata]|nr:hypothetical protein IG631_05225 [Alternaria alternata]